MTDQELHSLEGYIHHSHRSSNDFIQHILSEFIDLSQPIGYCHKYIGSRYCCYHVNSIDTHNDTINFRIYMHELGHIFYGHLEGIYEELNSLLLRSIEESRTELSSYINKSCGIDYASDLLDRISSNPVLNHSIHNLAMDMEVNSKLFSKEDMVEIDEVLGSLVGTVNKVRVKLKSIYPSDFSLKSGKSFSLGLSYPEYLILILENLDQFIELLSSGVSSIPSDIDSFEEMLDDLLGESIKLEESEEDISDYGDLDCGEGESFDIDNTDPIKEAIDEVIGICRKKIFSRKSIRDPLYLYNRGINRSVIASSYFDKVVVSLEFSVVFLLDVSGSMSLDLIQRILSSIRLKLKVLDPRLTYNLVCWSSSLKDELRDIKVSDNSPLRFKRGGGTKIDKGIEYIDKNYSKDSIIVILSDMYDNLDKWEKVTENMSGREIFSFNYGRKCYRKFKNIKVKNLS